MKSSGHSSVCAGPLRLNPKQWARKRPVQRVTRIELIWHISLRLDLDVFCVTGSCKLANCSAVIRWRSKEICSSHKKKDPCDWLAHSGCEDSLFRHVFSLKMKLCLFFSGNYSSLVCSGRQGRDAESKDVIFFLESLRVHLAAINRRSKENQAQNKKIQDGHREKWYKLTTTR